MTSYSIINESDSDLIQAMVGPCRSAAAASSRLGPNVAATSGPDRDKLPSETYWYSWMQLHTRDCWPLLFWVVASPCPTGHGSGHATGVVGSRICVHPRDHSYNGRRRGQPRRIGSAGCTLQVRYKYAAVRTRACTSTVLVLYGNMAAVGRTANTTSRLISRLAAIYNSACAAGGC